MGSPVAWRSRETGEQNGDDPPHQVMQVEPVLVVTLPGHHGTLGLRISAIGFTTRRG